MLDSRGRSGVWLAIWVRRRSSRPASRIGVTSRCILEALNRNGDGHLWSIDLPPVDRFWRQQVGAAVGDRYADRWTYIAGSSRRRLPELLSELGQIDLFVHDSLHSERNVRFELDRAWAAMAPKGAMVADDVDANWGFRSFTLALWCLGAARASISDEHFRPPRRIDSPLGAQLPARKIAPWTVLFWCHFWCHFVPQFCAFRGNGVQPLIIA